MYIQITTKCNMLCNHCCFSCTSQGENMSIKTFKAALALSDNINIGGGEPTVHPKFWEFLGLSLSVTDCVWLATNGKKTKTALALASLAKKGVISCHLSIDSYHESINEKVIEAFTKDKRPSYLRNYDNDYRSCSKFNNEINYIIASGRAKDWGSSLECPCTDFFIKPNGNIHQCGCEDSPLIGTVFNANIDYNLYDECHRSNIEENQTTSKDEEIYC